MSLAYRLHFPPSDHRIPQTDSHWQIAFVVVAGAVSIAIATIVTFAFERPLLRLGHGLSRREFAIPRWLNFGQRPKATEAVDDVSLHTDAGIILNRDH